MKPINAMDAAVFLDRDDTIIVNDGDLGDPEKVILIQGAASALASLRGLGYKLVVVTNQGGVARGKYAEADVDKVNARINEQIHKISSATIDRFYYCPYHPEGSVEQYRREHPWRKPQPGMLVQAAKDMRLDMTRSWMIGDQVRDIQAGKAAGVRTILLCPDPNQPPEDFTTDQRDAFRAKVEKTIDDSQADFFARSLIEAVRIIAQQRNPDPADSPASRAAASRRWNPAPLAATRAQENANASNAPRTTPSQSSATTPKPAPNGGATAAVATGVTVAMRAKETVQVKSPVVVNPPPARVAIVEPASKTTRSEGALPWVAEGVAASATKTAEVVEKPALQQSTNSAAAVELSSIVAPAREPATETSRSQGIASDQTLRQILHELRSQRSGTDDFSWLGVIAIVLQMIVGVCVLAGLWLGAGDYESFVRWISVAGIMQLATIAALLFRR